MNKQLYHTLVCNLDKIFVGIVQSTTDQKLRRRKKKTIAVNRANNIHNDTSPFLKKKVGGKLCGSGTSAMPVSSRLILAITRPYGSAAPEIPVLAARTKGSPCSIDLTRAVAKC